MIKIDQHDEAANFLMLVADEEKGLKETCQITPSEALNLIQPLHALIDDDLKGGPHIITADLEDQCISTCHCGVYSDLTKDKLIKDSLLKKAQNIPRKNLIACAERTAKWFCSSNLLETLKSEVNSLKSDSLDGL